MGKASWGAALGWLFCLLTGKVYAQGLPAATQNAQELQRQQQREQELRQKLQVQPDIRLPVPDEEASQSRLPVEETPCFKIERISLKGELSERFQWALTAANQRSQGQSDPALGRCLGSNGINQVMRRIQNAVIQRGYVTTRVLAEPQNLSGGELSLTLIPGRVREIRLSPDSNPRANLFNALPISAGDLLNLRDLEQALENLKRVPTVQTDIKIVPASSPQALLGESDLVITWQQTMPFRFNLAVDDSGSKATGKYQANFTLSYDHWWTLNDLFYVTLGRDLHNASPGKARGTQSWSAHYSIPWGYWQWAVNASEFNYRQTVVGSSQNYLYRGSSRQLDLRLSRLLYRDATSKTTFTLKGWTRASRNFIDDTEVEVQRRRTAGWEASMSQRLFMGAATLDANLAYRRGTGAQQALPAPEEAFGEGTSRMKLWQSEIQYQQPFSLSGQRWRYSTQWRAQWNRTPLVPQDRFSIGGRYTVRGFDGENVLSAERGVLIRNDLAWFIGPLSAELYWGVDYGQVSGPSAALLSGQHLMGTALGMRGQIQSLSYDLFIGEPVKKPRSFQTPATVTGFNLNWAF